MLGSSGWSLCHSFGNICLVVAPKESPLLGDSNAESLSGLSIGACQDKSLYWAWHLEALQLGSGSGHSPHTCWIAPYTMDKGRCFPRSSQAHFYLLTFQDEIFKLST